MGKITKNCATCGASYTINATPKFPAFEPDDCSKCAIAKDAKWCEDNAEFRAEMAREMMRQIDPITQ